MSHSLKPVTGQWYRHLDKGQPFRVISVERDEDLIEIQHFDGDLEEFEFAEWFDMDLELAAEPEDWTGPIDDADADVDADDLGDGETAVPEQDWRTSIDTRKRASEDWEKEKPEEESSETEP
jgi:hypothetical protein